MTIPVQFIERMNCQYGPEMMDPWWTGYDEEPGPKLASVMPWIVLRVSGRSELAHSLAAVSYRSSGTITSASSRSSISQWAYCDWSRFSELRHSAG